MCCLMHFNKKVSSPHHTCVFQFDIGIPSMTKCCNQHDRCYDTCGREKHDCDDQFQDCLETICRNVQRTLGLSQSVQGKRQNLPRLCRFIYSYPCQLMYNQYTNGMESDIVVSVVISRYINNCHEVMIEGMNGWPVDNPHNLCHRNTTNDTNLG